MGGAGDNITQRGRVCGDRQGRRNALASEPSQNLLAQILMPRVRRAAHAQRILARCGGMVLVVLGIAYDVVQRGKRTLQAGAVRGRLLIVAGVQTRIRAKLRQLQRLSRRDTCAVVRRGVMKVQAAFLIQHGQQRIAAHTGGRDGGCLRRSLGDGAGFCRIGYRRAVRSRGRADGTGGIGGRGSGRFRVGRACRGSSGSLRGVGGLRGVGSLSRAGRLCSVTCLCCCIRLCRISSLDCVCLAGELCRGSRYGVREGLGIGVGAVIAIATAAGGQQYGQCSSRQGHAVRVARNRHRSPPWWGCIMQPGWKAVHQEKQLSSNHMPV